MNATFSSPFTGTLALALAAVLPLQADVLIDTATTVGLGDPALDGQRVVVSGTTLTLAGPHTFSALVLSNHAVLTHVDAPSGQADHAIRLTVTGNVDIDGTSRIDANGRGFAEAAAPGFGGNGSYAGGGGGHGGRGHRSNGNPLNSGGAAFGSVLAPDSWGGPGGNGDSTGALTPGGGLIHLEVGGELLIAGTIRADGSGAWINYQGGAAGGTVYLKASTLRGSGVISANGGPGEWVDGGGGAGGRIALFFGLNEFTGTITAAGAGGAGVGGAGTVYLKPDAAPRGEVRIANGSAGEWTPLESPSPFDLVIGAHAAVYPPQPLSLGNVTLKEAGTLVQATGTTNLVLTTTGDCLIESGGVLTADGRGYPLGGDRGPGAGVHTSWPGSGAGHGGWGANDAIGAPGGRHYGSILQPVHMGSQGGDGDAAGTAGGGALRLQIGGTLTVNGRLSADGAGAPPNNAGGGSGGSIWITAHAVAGEGIIRANGGPGEWVDGGGGAGGRIALYLANDTFTGTVTAYGGPARRGGAGTVYRRLNGEAVGRVLVDNGGEWGNYTPIPAPEAYRLELSGRANVFATGALTLAHLELLGESTLVQDYAQTNVQLHILGDALISTNAQLTADGRGYPHDEDRGPGAGARIGSSGSGGSHGGLGGQAVTGAVAGASYDFIMQPTRMGSQGGDADGGAGTHGGGAIRLVVDGRLTVEGRLSADGAGSPPNNAGGGAGGSIYVTAGSLTGAGVISANGGPGEWVDGGGGGGGRIALHHGTNEFAGTITAFGGGGHQRGGAGTIYQRKTGSAFGQLLLHNGGAWGNYTPLASPESFQVTLAANAHVYPEAALTLQDLTIGPDTTFTHLAGQSRVELNVLSNLTVADGGSLDVNGRGYQAGGDRGPGGGQAAGPGGTGGGHGGVGATSVWGGVGGGTYDSITAPVERGSAGGPGDGGPGGSGGGAIRLVVGNTLKADGRITANGLNGSANNSGGGAGGGIHITAARLEGTGVILADGGHGEWVEGGGGAGGRIALHLGASQFSGSVLARGIGARGGGAGTVYTRLGTEAGGELVLDNSGNGGALSPLEVPPETRLVLNSGSYVYPPTPLSVVSLRLKPGAMLTHPTGQATLAVQVAQDFIIESGAVISVDGRGYPYNGDAGPGAGLQVSWGGSGAGHGGNGGVSASGASGGAVNGSALQPVAWGSQGGSGDGGPGGAGGGAIKFTVGGTLGVSGTLTANGVNGTANNSGGGAGGSIWIDAGRLAGAGVLTANGGAGEWVDGGGGSGGRIALHLGTNDFTGTLTAYGRGGRQAGAAGTIYAQFTGESLGHLFVDNGGTWGAFTPLTTPEPFKLTVANQAQVIPAEPLVVGSLTLETNTVLTHLSGQSAVQVVSLGDTVINGSVDVSGRGYPWGDNLGPGGGVQSSWGGSGAGHGGAGGRSATQAPGGAAYGSLLQPTTLGSRGGSGDGGPGGAGGGAVRLISGGTLTVNGSITANGLNGTANNSGGGSGGSIFLSSQSFAGVGSLAANGGAGEWVDGGGGAGGRIAVYRSHNSFTGTLSVEGAGGAARGENGTIHQAEAPTVIWLAPAEGWVDGVMSLQVAALGAGSTPASMQFSHVRDGVATAIATVPGTITAETQWNTLTVADGAYDLQVTVRDSSGRTLAEGTRRVLVNNSVVWHRGTLADSATWSAGKVHVVDGDFVVTGDAELTIEPGAVVKFVGGSRFSLQAGATLNALGTAGNPVVLTSFPDDTAGGDSNLDGAESRPVPGAWRLALQVGSVLEQNQFTALRYHSQSFGGVLADNQTTWTGDSLREVTETVIVPNGATLTIEAGAILKFASGAGIDINSGGSLVVNGTLAQPVIFTSVRDDACGGDTNDDGSRSKPAAGDWRSLRFHEGSSGQLNHTEVRYGGNSVGNPWGAGGAIEALGGPLSVKNSIIADALKDGAFCYGTTRFENCLVLRCDRGLTAVGEMTILNCTLDANRIGLLEHVGQLIVRNTIVANSIDVGIEHDLGGGVPVVTHCNVFNPGASRGNYNGVSDRTGQDGNLSVAPRYRNRDLDNFRLNFTSPGIDAASGTVAPTTDYAGVARFDDPRTGNTGVPAANGAVPDMGAFEFADNAPSNLDLVVESVTAPTQLTAGGLAHVEWTIVNRGTEAFSGPWHDALSLRLAGTTGKLPVSEILVGQNVTLGPGQSFRASADVRVPGGVNGSYQWVVSANSRGDIFESANAANNETTAEASATLQVPMLVLDGGQISAQFVAQEEQHWFAVTAPSGKDVRLNLDLLAASGITELYAGRGFVPTPDSFTSRQREWSSADTSVVVSGAGNATGEQNVFYVLAVGRVLSTTPDSYTLRASTADFTVEQVKPATVGSAGLVTLEINGSKFSTNTVFAVRVGAERREAVRQSVRESGRVFATFNLDGLTPGPADVVAESDGLTVSLTAAVNVVAGGTPDFYVSLSGPATSRAGRTTTWFVTYGNRGQVDQPLPLLRFRAPGAAEIRLFDHTRNWADSFVFLGLNGEHFLPTLGPGQEVTVPVQVRTSSSTSVNVDVVTGEAFAAATSPFNWSSLTAPAGADPTKWSALLATLPDRLGLTVGDYAAKLQADLEDLAASELRYSYVANVNGQWIFGDEPVGVSTPNPSILVPDDVLNEPTAVQRHFASPAKIPGDGIRKTYFVVISIEDYSNMWGNTHTNDLRGTRKDSEDMRKYLDQDLRVPDEQQYVGHDSPTDNASWTRDNILETIRSFKGKLDADDNLVVVLSGHGGWSQASGVGYFCANGGYVSPAAFAHAVDEVGAGTTYLVNDSCHSEAFNENVNTANTTFVGFAGTKKDRISWDTASGGELVSNLKGQLRKCHGLGDAFERAQKVVTDRYATKTNVVHQQSPVLTNPSGNALEGKPWNDPSGFWQELNNGLNRLGYNPWSHTILTIVGSVDPNDKYALAGAGPEHWVQVGQVLPFEIVFENKTNAAAPAQEVVVFDDLDPRLDWSTFELKSLAFNDASIAVPPGLQRFTTTTTVGTDTNVVAVDVSFNPATGRITWLMWSRDAATGELPEDPFAGFLPPNDASHRGEGSLSYVIRPKADLADGTRLTNRATIIFDPTYGANPPIVTPMVTNAIDASLPTSAVLRLPAENNGTVEVQWTGSDATGSSGIASFDVYVARDRGPYLLWQIATTATSATFTGEPGSIYHFYSVARDAAGNTEAAPESADAFTTVAGGYTYATWVAGQNLPANAKGPDDDAEGDGLSNFAEYAYALNPLVPDRALSVPKAAFATVGGQDYLTLTYRRPKTEPTDVQYRVTASTMLTTWAGLTTTQLGAPVDRGAYMEVTVRAPAPAGGATAGFLRLELTR